jgi:hypothetical protein
MTEVTDLEILDLQQLGQLYEETDCAMEDLKAQLVEVKKTIFDKMEGDSEEVGNYLAYRSRVAKFPDLSIEKAEALGLVKIEKKIDNNLAKKAYNNGADLGKVEWGEAMVMRKKTVSEETSE